MKIPPKVYNLRRNFFAFIIGCIAGFIPNNKSNIPPYLLGIIFAILATKIVYGSGLQGAASPNAFGGDYDIGYQWFSSQYNWEPNASRSQADIIFLIVIGSLGAAGAELSSRLLYWFKNRA